MLHFSSSTPRPYAELQPTGNRMPTDHHARLKGIFNITATPFGDDGSIDIHHLAETIERMITEKFDGLLIGGTYGEFPAMSPADRAELFRRSIEFARDRVPVMLCSAASDPRLAMELTELASSLGGYAMVTAPYVSEVTEDHIFEFFRWIAPAAKRGLVIYNAPGIGITLSARLIERVSAINSVVGLKQGDLSPTAIDELANRVGGKLRLFCASDLAFLGPMMAGFDGLSSTNSSAFPELISGYIPRRADRRRADSDRVAPRLVFISGVGAGLRPATNSEGSHAPPGLEQRVCSSSAPTVDARAGARDGACDRRRSRLVQNARPTPPGCHHRLTAQNKQR